MDAAGVGDLLIAFIIPGRDIWLEFLAKLARAQVGFGGEAAIRECAFSNALKAIALTIELSRSSAFLALMNSKLSFNRALESKVIKLEIDR